MRLLPDEDEREFASTVRRLLLAGSDQASLRASLARAGVLGLVLPEGHGGSGARLTDLGSFYVEAGRGLCPLSVHATIAAGLAIDALGTQEQHAALLPDLAAGRACATTALSSPVDAAVVTPALRAEPTRSCWTLSGHVDFVLGAGSADYVVVSAKETAGETGGGRTLVFVVPMNIESVRAEPLTVMGSTDVARLHFDGVVVEERRALGADRSVPDERLHRLANTAMALLSLDLVGVGEAALQRSVDHTVQRRQFGRPIASFQAAQHLVANMHIALAAARLAAWAAVSLLDEGHLATRQTAVARMHASTAAKLATLDAHQLHGGIGYVVDTDLHRYSERARVLSTLGGGADIAANWLEEAQSR